jgi:four helix bundle protein
MNPEELKKRTKEFALRVLRFVNSMQRGRTEDILTKQLARAACRARSRADFVSKITIVEEEADETQYWLELLLDQSRVNKREIIDLLDEAKELTAIFTASGKTAKWGTLIS